MYTYFKSIVFCCCCFIVTTSKAQKDNLILEQKSPDPATTIADLYEENIALLAIEFSKKTQDSLLLQNLIRGREEMRLDHPQKAWSFYAQLMDPALSKEDLRIRVRLLWGQFWAIQQQLSRSKSHLEKALHQATKNNAKAIELMCINNLLLVYPHLNDHRSAYFLTRRYIKVYDELHKGEIQEAIEQLNLKFKTEEKANEILTLENHKVEQKLSLISAKAKAKQWYWWGLSATLSLMILTAGFWIYFRYNQNRQRLEEAAAAFQHEKILQAEEEQKHLNLQAMLQGEARERTRIAKELHDGVGVLLSTLKLSIGKQASESMVNQQSIQLVDEASAKVRRIAHNMMPESLNKFGLVAAIEDLCDEFNYRKTLHITFQQFGISDGIPKVLTLYVYRIVQELLELISTQTKATEVVIQIFQRNDRLILLVEDNDSRFKQNKQYTLKNHFLWQRIHNRTTYLEGDISTETIKDQGTTFTIDLPIHGPASVGKE